jgi:hypothetical protein
MRGSQRQRPLPAIAAITAHDMSIRVIQRSRDDYFYLIFPSSPCEVYVSGERIVVTLWLLDGIRLTELRTAARRLLRRYDNQIGSPGWATEDEGAVFQVYDASPEEFLGLDDDLPLFIDADILAGSSGVRVRVVALADTATSEARIGTLAETAASRMHARVRVIEREWENASGVGWGIEAEFRRRDALVTGLLTLGKAIATTVGELANGMDPDAVVNVIEAGFPAGLIGAKEDEWLEAKSQPWDLDTEYGKIELAQDVARLANAAGGVIVVGATTRKVDGEETVTRVGGIRPDRFSPHRARMTIDARVYPPVEGLTVRRVPIKDSDHSIGYLRVPPQDSVVQPFLVHGSIVGRKVEGSFISIVKRRGDQSLSVRAEELHQWLTAGRRLAREGRLRTKRASKRDPKPG